MDESSTLKQMKIFLMTIQWFQQNLKYPVAVVSTAVCCQFRRLKNYVFG